MYSGLPSGLVPSGFATKTLRTFVFVPISSSLILSYKKKAEGLNQPCAVQGKCKWASVVHKRQGITWPAEWISTYQEWLGDIELWIYLWYEICLETNTPTAFSLFAIGTCRSNSLFYEIFVCYLTNTIPCKFVAMIPAVSLFCCLFTLSITHSLSTRSVEIEIHKPYELVELRRSVCLFVCKFDSGGNSLRGGGRQNTELTSYFSFNGQLPCEPFLLSFM